MWKWFAGPVLLGCGCLAGSVYGRDAEQLVHRKPSDTYAGIEQALDNVPHSGTTHFEGGTPMPYEVRVAPAADNIFHVAVIFGGREGADADIALTPQNGGKDTLITTRIHGDHEVLRLALAGAKNARLAYAPDWMLNLAVRPVLAQLAAQIEQGQTTRIAEFTPADAEAQWESNLSDDQRAEVQEWRQYDATRPDTDPDAEASRFMNSAD